MAESGRVADVEPLEPDEDMDWDVWQHQRNHPIDPLPENVPPDPDATAPSR